MADNNDDYDDDIAQERDDIDQPEPPPPRKERKRSGKVANIGAFILALIVASSDGAWSKISIPSDALDTSISIQSGHIIGLALTRWRFMHNTDFRDVCPKWLFDAELDRSRSRRHHGFLLYPCERIARLTHAQALPNDHMSNSALMNLVRTCLAHNFDFRRRLGTTCSSS